MKKLLIVDDDMDMCLLLKQFLVRRGYKAEVCNTCGQAWDYLQYSKPDLIICDVRLEDMDGITFLRKVNEAFNYIPFIFITGYDDIKTSANALKYGALNYITKPLLPEEIATIVENALKTRAQTHDETSTRSETPQRPDPGFFYGSTALSNKLQKQVNLIAPTNCNVVIQGESGTGKNTLAFEIHNASSRAGKPFVIFNCTALKTDAIRNGKGGYKTSTSFDNNLELLAKANGGTLLLDEVADLPTAAQEFLFTAIRNKTITNSNNPRRQELDIRLVTSSSINLWQAANRGFLSNEVYHFLNDYTIDVLPLRNRTDDIMLYAKYFLEKSGIELGKKVTGFNPEVETVFKNHIWQDNVRELKKIITKAVFLTESPVIDTAVLPAEILNVSKNTSVSNKSPINVLS